MRHDINLLSPSGERFHMTTPFGRTDTNSYILMKTKKAVDKFVGSNDIGIITSNQAMELYTRLRREYKDEMIKAGISMRYSEIKKKDTIDLRSLQPDPSDTGSTKLFSSYPVTKSEKYRDYLKNLDRQSALCNAIPPLSECVFRLSETQRIHVKVMEIDEPGFTVTLKLDLYVGNGSAFDITTSSTLKFIFMEDMHVVVKKMDGCFTAYEQNKRIPHRTLEWNQNDVTLWETINEQYYKEYYSALLDVTKKTNDDNDECVALGHTAMMAISICNYMLETNKVSTKRTSRTHTKSTMASSDAIESTKNELKVRTIGTIKVTSKDMPRKVTIENIRHYRTPIWKARGGIRHYKNGKTVRFKESIRVRKALADQVTPEQIASLRTTQLRLVENDPSTLEKLHKTNNT